MFKTKMANYIFLLFFSVRDIDVCRERMDNNSTTRKHLQLKNREQYKENPNKKRINLNSQLNILRKGFPLYNIWKLKHLPKS